MDVWLYALALVFGAAYNCIRSYGTNKKVVLTVNGVLVGMLLFVLIFSAVDGAVRSGYERDFSRHSGGVFSSAEYVETVDDHHIIQNFAMFSDAEYIAIPKQNCRIPLITYIYHSVIIYYSKDRPLYTKNSVTKIGDRECFVSNSAVAVFPNYFSAYIIILIIDLPLLFLFNLTEIFIVANSVKKE